MPVLGVVLTLEAGPPRAGDLIREIRGVALVGAPTGARLPVVLETWERGEDEALFDRLRAVAGVVHIDLVFADFSDLGLTPPRSVIHD